MYVSFPDMMQGNKGNIKVNLGIAFIYRLTRFYCGIIVFCLYSDMALYNTSRLYYLLQQVDNFNATIETAKRILTKEKIDKQKTAQSSTAPFMKASQEKSKKNEKGVLCGALDTKEPMCYLW